MNFEPTEEQLAILDECRRFAANELSDDIIARDRDAVFSPALWKKCADFGILGLPFPSEFGGSEADIMATVMAMEGLGIGCRDSGLIFSLNAQMWSIQMPLWHFGTRRQQERYLPELINGSLIGAHGMSEPNTGSDAFALETSAGKRGNEYILNGTKTFVTNAPVADLYIVFARTDRAAGIMGISAFVIEKGHPGIRVGQSIHKSGLRTSPMAELVLEDCVLNQDHLVGREGRGVEIFNHSMDWERSCILAGNLGTMRRQMQSCIRYANERNQYGQPIASFPAISNKLIDMQIRLESARLLLYKVAWKKQHERLAALEAAMVKFYMGEACVRSCLDAVQIHGGYGITVDYEVERELRDSLGGRIYSGTSEIQKNLIARNLGL